MNIRRKSQVNDFERLDAEGEGDDDVFSTPQTQTSSKSIQKKNGEEYPTGKTSDHYRAIQKSHSTKAISKAKKLVKKSRYSSLDGAFPSAVVVNNDNNKKSTIDLTPRSAVTIPIQSTSKFSTETSGKAKDEFYFEANFDEVEAAQCDHYFEAIFEDDCESASYQDTSSTSAIKLDESYDNSKITANLHTKSDHIKRNDDRPSTPNTLASSSISSDSRPSTPGASVSPSTSTEDSSVNSSARSDEISTPDESSNRITKKKFLGKKKTSYQKLDYHSASDEKVQLELDQRLKAIHKLKDVTIEQSKKIKKMQLSNKANKIRLILFRKEITYLRLQNADLKERVTKLEDDLKTAKDDAVVSEEEANRMCTALVLIREQIDEAEHRAENLDENFEVEDLFAGGEGENVPPNFDEIHSNSNTAEGVEEKVKGSETIANEVTGVEDIGIEFDAFGLYVKDGKE